MIRTIISLEPEEKYWLDSLAKRKHTSMAAIIRTAIHEYQLKVQAQTPTKIVNLLNETKGTWENEEDGLAYQQKIRGEWEE